MFDRFTTGARRVVVLAQEEARLLNHNYIGTEHLLLGLIRERDGVAAEALGRLGASIDVVRALVEEISVQGGAEPRGHVPFTPQTKRVLERSLREAVQLGHDYIGTEHLLLGLIHEGEGVAAQVLAQLGLDLSRVGREVIQLLSEDAAPVAGPPPAERGVTPAAVRAREEAQRLAGEGPVGTHHVLAGILRNPESLGAKALAALGVTPEALEAELARLSPADTTDELPEEAGARLLSLELVDDRIGVFLADGELRDRLAAFLGREPKVIRHDHPAATSFPALWQDLTRHLTDMVRRLERDAPQR